MMDRWYQPPSPHLCPLPGRVSGGRRECATGGLWVRSMHGGGVLAATSVTPVDAHLDGYTAEGILRECGGPFTRLIP